MTDSVLIVDDRRDILELNRILLESEGYKTDGCAYSEATAERLLAAAPRVVLLDLVAGDEAPWALLQRLRRDDATRDIGVVVTSDTPALVDKALCDGTLGVAAGLVMPFDIEALYSAIAAAAHDGRTASAPPERVVTPTIQRAAEAVSRSRQKILVRWAQRLSALDAFRAHPDLSLVDLLGQGEALLDGVARALSLQASGRAIPAAPAGISLDAAIAHARLRRSQGIGPGAIAREMSSLRREAWREARVAIEADRPSIDEVSRVLNRISLALDESLFAMLEAYDESVKP